MWNELSPKDVAAAVSAVDSALRDCRTAMRRFAPLGTSSGKLAATYPALRQLRLVIAALDKALSDGRAEVQDRRREAIGVPLRRARHRKAAPDYEAAQARQQAARELDTARRHIGNATQLLAKYGNAQLVVQLRETAQFLALATHEARRE